MENHKSCWQESPPIQQIGLNYMKVCNWNLCKTSFPLYVFGKYFARNRFALNWLAFRPFSTNVPLMDKPGSWFLLAQCLKNTCGRVAFSVKMQVNDLHRYWKCHSSTVFFKHFASKNQLPGLSVSGTLVENGLK